MKLALTSPTYFGSESVIGGGERYVHELALALSRHANVELVSFGRAGRTIEIGPRFVLRIHRACYPRGNIANPLNLLFLGDLRDADVIHCFQYSTLISNLSVVYARLAGRKVFATDLGGGGPSLSRVLRLGRYVNAFLLLSRFSARGYGEYGSKVRVIYGGVDAGRFRPSGAGKGEKVLFVGRVAPHKGVNYLIEAMPRRALLEVVGTGPADRGYYEYLLEVSRGSNVRFRNIGRPVGSLEADRLLAEEYSSALVTVLPSVYRDVYGNYSPAPELLGLVLLESMACGTPVIATSVGGLPEVVEDGRTGFVVPPNDPGALREKIQYFLDNPGESVRMGAEGKRVVLERFTWERVAERCLRAYREF